MEEKKTINQYKRTLRGTMGAGASALFSGNGRKFYVLEHRDASKYHRAGESQKIIIDQIELGCNPECQVRFDQETWGIVSRRHAAIIREGSRWKLVQLSQTNSTLLNGRKIDTQWYLESGDEIQLAVGGPRLGFIVPEGKQGLVSSIKLTERMELFRKQALRPYKHAIAALSILLVLAVGGLTTWNVLMQKDFNEQIALAKEKLTSITGKNAELDSLLKASQLEQARMDSLLEVYKKRPAVTKVIYPNDNLASMLSKIENDIFFVRATKVVVTDGEETIELPNYSWISTGFLTTDGRFITAKHCVEGWKFKGGIPNDEEALAMCAFAMNTKGCKIVAYLEAKSKSKTLTFKSTDFIMNASTEHEYKITDEIVWHLEGNMRNDWAYVNTNQKGSIVVDFDLSTKLPVGADLHILGFPHGWGAIDTHNFSSLYNSCKVAKEGLENGIIRISDRSFEGGNSGGPVFYNDHGKLKAVGIVSYGVGESHGGVVSLSNLH